MRGIKAHRSTPARQARTIFGLIIALSAAAGFWLAGHSRHRASLSPQTAPSTACSGICIQVDVGKLNALSYTQQGVSLDSSEGGLVTELLHDSSFELGALAALWPSEEPLLTGTSTATLVAVGSGDGSSSSLQSLAAVADAMPAAQPGTWQWSDIVEASYTGIAGGQLGAAAHALCISASTTEDVVLFHTGHTGQGFPVAKGSSIRLQMRMKGHAHIIQVLLTSLDDKTTCSLTHVVRQHDQSDEDWEELSVTLTATHACPQARLLLRWGGLSQVCLDWVSLTPESAWDSEGKLRRFHQQLVEAVKHLGPQFARIPVQRSPRFAEGTQEPRPLPGLLFPNLGAGGLSLLDTMELARQLGAAPLLVLSLSSPASPRHNPDLLPLTQDVLASLEFLTANSSSRWGAEREAQGQSQPLPLTHLVVGQDADCSQPWYAQVYQQLAAAVRASFPHLQLLACADLGPLPVMDGWELQAQLDPDTTARLGEGLDAYQGKPLSVVLGQPYRSQGTGARPGDSVLAGLMAAARSLVLERHCDRVTMVSSQGLLLPAQTPSQPWGKHHSLIVYSATHQALETPAAQLHHLLRQHQGSLCAKDWQLLSSPDDSGQVESSASCNDAACTHLILKLVNQGHMKQAVTVTIQHTVPHPAPSWWSQTPRPSRLLLAGSEATTWAVKGPDDAGPTFEHPSNQLFQAQPAQLTVVPTVSDNTHVSLIVQLLPHSFTVAHLHLAQEPHDPVP